jgi:hypothetical protein
VDVNDNRRIKVTIHGPVGTFFARVIGINSWPAERIARADFVLPVPMGSPQNYFGVSALYGTTSTTVVNPNLANKNSGPDVATTAAGGTTPWTSSPANNLPAAVANADTSYVLTTTNGAVEVFGGFGLMSSLNTGETIVPGQVTGLQVKVNGALVSNTCASSKIDVALSWNGGGSWTTVTAQTGLLINTAASSTFGSTASTAFWAGHTAWTQSELGDTNFKVRLTAIKGCAQAGRELRADQIQVQVNYQTTTPTSTTTIADDPTVRAVRDPATSTPLVSQGFWGASITRGGERSNGDRYGPAYNGKPAGNAEYDGKGYDYSVEVGVLGNVSIYDPTFCATGGNLSSGYYGTGDHYIGAVGPVTTVFTLFDTRGTPYNPGDDIQKATSGALFAGQQQRDASGTYGDTSALATGTPAVTMDCSTDAYHNKWYTLATALPAGTYRLNVTTADPGNLNTSAENLWSVWVSGGAKPRVYGGGRMAAYTNLSAGTSNFFLAQIPKEHAGKTMFITLFDPGDVNGGGWLRILTPDGNAYNPASFTFTADANASSGHTSGSGTCIQTNGGSTAGLSPPTGCTNLTSGGSFFQNSVLTIAIGLPANYGSVGLTPPGVPGAEAGWWKIEYTVGGGNDTTTWNVSIRGNPVHLILP